MGEKLDLLHPETFNQKLQWLKLYDRNPLYTKMVDKYAVKEYVASIIGAEHVIPTYGIWDSPSDIEWESLPQQFVLKNTHGSGGHEVVICKDKEKFDKGKAVKILKEGNKSSTYEKCVEWPYKDIPRRIIAEQYLSELDSDGVSDYKIHCFGGEAKFVLVCKNRFSGTGLTEDFFTTEWTHLEIQRPEHDNYNGEIERPSGLEKMIEYAELLSKDIAFLRVDFYAIGDNIYFGEMTFYPASGYVPFIPSFWDKTFGDWLSLPEKEKQFE